MIDFDLAYSQFHTELLNQTVARCGNLQVAQDVCCEVWARAWKRRATYSEARGTVRAWLGIIARSALMDFYRSNGRQTLPLLEAAEPAAPSEDRPDLASALSRLPEPWAEAVRLIYLEEKTFPEAAKALGLSVGCVHGRTKLGLNRLRRILAA